MIIPSLPDDCIHEIFQYLQNDRTTLYQCLFVNKFWCGCAIPLLWKQPFSNFRCWEFIIRTYLDCLKPLELLNLKPYNLLIPFSSSPPLFEYERYLESFSNSDMEIGIITWLRFGTSDLPEISLFHEIKSLSYPGISKLKSLDCCIGHKNHEIKLYQNTMNLLQNWGIICTSLKRIWVSVCEENVASQDLISNIIKSQKYLLEFKFTGVDNITENVITSLKYNSQFLITLKFWMLKLDGISFEGLSSLKTLESLDIQWSGDTLLDLKFDIITMETIESASNYCPNIINLCTTTKKECYDYLFPWIKKLKLKKLDFYSSGIDLSEGIRLLGENISPTLTYLNFDYISCTPESFEYFLKLCKAPLTTLVILFSKEFIDNCLERIKDFVVERKSMRNLVFVCTPILWLKWSKKELEIIKIMEKYGLKVVKSISRKF
ncbi:1243_t:CDS:2 [Diversispora eburnea]|uniref:1243_t:CDS:1 n=1 Tax=Diversispora eburnea TaxID=1213867 RepID=A0A9N9AUF5_9GLOM|nr:1243_t:CDS:2 [Diversispora eburnea]